MKNNKEQVLLESLQEISISNKSLSIALEKALKKADEHQNSYHELEAIAITMLESMNNSNEDWTVDQVQLFSRLEKALKRNALKETCL